METITIRQAYDAMILFLDGYYQRGKSDDIGALLGGLGLVWLDPSTGERWPGDPAYWDDWMESVQKILFPDTPENRQMLVEMISNIANYLGTVEGSEWYAKFLPDGRQLWANVRNEKFNMEG